MSSHSRTSVVIALGATQTIAWGSTYYLPAILARPMAAEFGVAASTVFAMFSLALLLSAIGGPFVGRWIDRFGGRGTLVASNFVFAAGLALMAWAPSLAWLWLAWLLMGAGMAMGLYESAFSALAAAYGSEARPSITGITLIAGFASTVGWPLTGYLDAEIGWRGACLVWSAIHLFICAPVNRLMIPPGSHAAPVEPPKSPQTSRADTRAMVLLAYVFAATWFTSTAMAAHLPALLQLTGASAAGAIAAAALVGPAQVAARLFEFTLMRRTHPLLTARLATLAHPLGAGVLLVFGAPVAALFTLIHGAGNGVLTIAKGTLPLAIFGPSGYGYRQGLLSGPARIGQAAAPLAFGVAIDALGPGALILTALLGFSGYAAMLALGHANKP